MEAVYSQQLPRNEIGFTSSQPAKIKLLWKQTYKKIDPSSIKPITSN